VNKKRNEIDRLLQTAFLPHILVRRKQAGGCNGYSAPAPGNCEPVPGEDWVWMLHALSRWSSSSQAQSMAILRKDCWATCICSAPAPSS